MNDEQLRILTWLYLHISITSSKLRPTSIKVPAGMVTNYRVDIAPAMSDKPEWLPPFNGTMLMPIAKFTDWWTKRMRKAYGYNYVS